MVTEISDVWWSNASERNPLKSRFEVHSEYTRLIHESGFKLKVFTLGKQKAKI